jgi:hypothetical protein
MSCHAGDSGSPLVGCKILQSMNTESFIVDRKDLRRATLIAGPTHELASVEVFARVDRFAFTANNLTYAELGDRFGFWQLFPAPEGLMRSAAFSAPPISLRPPIRRAAGPTTGDTPCSKIRPTTS